MYFRTKKIKNTPLVQLVESYRNDAGQPRQRVVVSLGDVYIPEDEKKTIAHVVEKRMRGEYDLFTPSLSEEGAKIVDTILHKTHTAQRLTPVTHEETLDGVLIDKVEVENAVQLGPELVALKAWKELQLDEILGSTGMSHTVINRVKLLVSNRLIEPQ